MQTRRIQACAANIGCRLLSGALYVIFAASALAAAPTSAGTGLGPGKSIPPGSRVPVVVAQGAPDTGDVASRSFQLRVCNRTPRSIWVSLASRPGSDQTAWYVEGWWRVPAHDCLPLGEFARPTIYLHAENGKGRLWNGVDAEICVQRENFRRRYSAATPCSGQMRGFYKKSIDSSWTSFEWRVGQ
jgi:uncharacterized membrane protein